MYLERYSRAVTELLAIWRRPRRWTLIQDSRRGEGRHTHSRRIWAVGCQISLVKPFMYDCHLVHNVRHFRSLLPSPSRRLNPAARVLPVSLNFSWHLSRGYKKLHVFNVYLRPLYIHNKEEPAIQARLSSITLPFPLIIDTRRSESWGGFVACVNRRPPLYPLRPGTNWPRLSIQQHRAAAPVFCLNCRPPPSLSCFSCYCNATNIAYLLLVMAFSIINRASMGRPRIGYGYLNSGRNFRPIYICL